MPIVSCLIQKMGIKKQYIREQFFIIMHLSLKQISTRIQQQQGCQKIYFFLQIQYIHILFFTQMIKNKERSSLGILIAGRIYEQSETFQFTKRVVEEFQKLVDTSFYFMDTNTEKKIKDFYQEGHFYTFKREQDTNKIDYVVTIGGDGTILYAAKQFSKISPPFLTFQKGTLGFLCKFRPDEIQYTIKKSVQQKMKPPTQGENDSFDVCKLMRLTCSIRNSSVKQLQSPEKKVILNEVSITRKDSNRIALDIFIDGEQITTTKGDGILISTPTGSTAYALSAGGPIISNGVNTILIVPMAPNSLSFRPICLPCTSIVKIKLSKKSKTNALASFDGQYNIQMTEDQYIEIKYQEGKQNADLILFQHKKSRQHLTNMPTWLQRLKNFLGWNEIFKSPVCEKPFDTDDS